jgi:hypothetical protein
MRRQPEASFTISLWLGSQRSLATTPLRGSPPVRPVAFRGEVLERRSDGLGVRSRAAAEAELPQFLRRLVVAVDHLVDIVDVELARSVALDRLRDMLHQPGELRLVVRRHERAGDSPTLLRPASPLGRHGRTSVRRRLAPVQADVADTGGRQPRQLARLRRLSQ